MSDIGWRASLTPGDQDQIREVIAAATLADGVAPVGEQVLRELPLQRTKHLVAADGQRIVGFLNLTPGTDAAPPMAELVVTPDSRRHGIGASLV
ncbi:MAG TPA: GNAT family N-acetyltransferase, partial [Mycobacterium sp.]|nr:GNAT family N-acetyltransferase [Mycobacterium sp.]